MRVIQSWLREICPNNVKASILADLLTEQGMECERYIEFRNVLQNHTPVKIIEISELDDHKDVKVETDQGIKQLKTRAIDIDVNDNVAANLESLLIPTLEELGINNLRCALQVPPEYGWEGVANDVLFDFSTLSNRGDQLSVLGIAREATYCTEGNIVFPLIKHMEPSENKPTADKSAIILEAPELCSRYVGVSFKNINIRRSPAWMRYRLSTCGLRPVNNIVDITNYILWELGQPLHAFDRDNLKGSKIIVRKAKSDEKFIAINHNEYKLKDTYLAICDEEKIRALAGVMGGVDSEVTDSTSNLFLESAWFLQANNRRTAKTLGLISDSSHRFSRGVDPEGALRAAHRFIYLVQKLNCGEVINDSLVDEQVDHVKPNQIVFEALDVIKLLGVNIKKMFMKEALEKIGCKVFTRDNRDWEVEDGCIYVTPPSWRHDIRSTPDLSEEIMRMKGYSALKPELPRIPLEGTEPVPTYQFETRVRNFMARSGCVEHRGSCFTDEKTIIDLLGENCENALRVKNPDNREQAFLLPTLLASLIKVVSHNRRHNRLLLPVIFEVARVYGISKSLPTHYAYHHERNGMKIFETRKLGFISSLSNNKVELALENDTTLTANYFAAMRGLTEKLFKHLKISDIDFNLTADTEKPSFAENSIIIKVDNTILGYICLVKKTVCSSNDIDEDLIYSEINLDALLPLTPKRFSIYPISAYPSIIRDLALLVPLEIAAKDLLHTINSIPCSILADIRPFDQYIGKGVDHPLSQARSLAIQFTFQSQNQTLESTDIDEFIFKVLKSLCSNHKIILRDWEKLKAEDMFADASKWLEIVKQYQGLI